MNPSTYTRRDTGRWTSALSLLVIAALTVSLSGCGKLKARDELNKGVAAYKGGLYDQAINHFLNAKRLDPSLLNARLYLATAYASQYIPGAPSEENVQKGNQAIAEFQDVLNTDPKNVTAINGIASLLYNMAGSPYSPEKLEESKKYHQLHIQLKGDDPEPYYSVGVIDWTLAWKANMQARRDYNSANPKKQVHDDQPLPPKLRQEFTAKYGPMVEEGLQALQKAIALRSDYDDAMAYENLLLRQKADMVDDMAQRDALIKQAEDLVEKVKEIKQKKMENAAKS